MDLNVKLLDFQKKMKRSLGSKTRKQFLDLTPKVQSIRQKFINLTSSKFKSFALRKTRAEDEKTGYKVEKTFANYFSDKGLLSKLYKELSVLNSKKVIQSEHRQKM